MTRWTLLTAVAALMLGGLAPAEARAFTQLDPTAGHTGHPHWIYAGRITHNSIDANWVCFDDLNHTNSGGDHWVQIGTSATLNDDYEIHGGSTSDTMIVIIASSTVVSGNDCAGTWNGLVYGAHYLDLVGDGGDDYLYSGIGDSYTYGLGGADRIIEYSGSGPSGAYGGTGNDRLWGWAGSADILWGEDGSDCLYDFNNTWNVFMCGSGSDDYYNGNTPSGPASCENPVASCPF